MRTAPELLQPYNDGTLARTYAETVQPVVMDLGLQTEKRIGLIEIVCDGGISFNPGGRGYGSFQVDGAIHRLKFDKAHKHTNNTAETETVLHALKWLLQEIGDCSGKHVLIRTDSKLLCKWVNKRCLPKSDWSGRLVGLLGELKLVANSFGSVYLKWQPRERSVEILGH